jgi:glycosyltransferase involved in cell wall biosynthesis
MLITKLRKLKRDNKIDISVSFGEQANIINVLSKKKEHIYLSMRTTLSKEMQNRPKKRILTGLIKRLYNRAEAIVVPSALAANDLEQSFDVRKNKLEIIHNYVDSVAINKLSDEPISDTELFSLFRQKILLNVGRITPAKGQWLLLHLFKKLKERIPEARLVIIGEGESERHFKMKLVQLCS